MVYIIKPQGPPKDADFTRVAFEVPGTKRPGQTGHYRNEYFPDLLTTDTFPLKTLPDIFESGLAKSRDRPCLGSIPILSTHPKVTYANHFVWETYAEVDVRRRALGASICRFFSEGLFASPDGGFECVGVWSRNRPEWQVVDLACQLYGKVMVSLYDTLGPDAVSYVIDHASVSLIFATPDKIPDLLRLAGTKVKTLKTIVSMDDLEPETHKLLSSWASEKKIRIFNLSTWEREGKKNPVEPPTISPTTLATICYTSGTTGNPKGAMITHGALAVSSVSSLYGTAIKEEALFFSYLPLAHIYERFGEQMQFALGNAIGYSTGDVTRLLEDMALLSPHGFPSVPRVLNRVYQQVQLKREAPGVAGWMLNKAIEDKLANYRATGIKTHAIWDRLVFNKIKKMLGGRISLLTSGSAPISKDVLEFLNISIGGDIIEGYGLTETCGTATRNYGDDRVGNGTVGPPFITCEIKLVDVPEMGYTSLDKPFARGELCVKGENCFSGYYRDPENTAKTIDSEGWTHTGDVAHVDAAGRFTIIDRIKNIMKLSQGEYVALEKVENTYTAIPTIASIFVYGDSYRDHLVAVVVPDPGQLAELARKLGVTDKRVDIEDRAGLDKLAAEPKVNKAYMIALDAAGDRAKLRGFERVKAVYLTNEPFTAENGLLTPTFKIKRKEAKEFFQEALDKLYGGKL